MLFNSLEFALFFLVVYSLYLVLAHKWQNRMLLMASYVFYAAWDWRFLSLILISTTIDYFLGIRINGTEEKKRQKLFLTLSVISNLSILGFFKYFDFFAGNLITFCELFGWHPDAITLKIILPVGISFYTFQSMSYTLDIYRREIKPIQSFPDFALYVAYFPQLVAGPIERAKHLLPQVIHPRTVDVERIKQGLALIGWGLFKKIVIADNMARIVNPIFAQAEPASGLQVLVGVYAFAFQIYGDFSGYSDIARGLGKMMGFDIVLNFNLPYFAKNPQEFWQRWHISLSTWLKDYLYIPLGGGRQGKWKTYRNLMLTMVLGGLWHGAAWKFLIWGIYHGFLLGAHRMMKPVMERIIQPKTPVGLKCWSFARIIIMFHLVCLGWLIFRAESLTQCKNFLESLFVFGVWDREISVYFNQFCFYGLSLFIMQLVQYYKKDLSYFYKAPLAARFLMGALLTFVFIVSAVAGLPVAEEFIYFQF